MEQNDRVLMTISEVAQRFNVTTETVYRWVKLGLLKPDFQAYENQKKMFFDQNDVENFTPPKRGRPRKNRENSSREDLANAASQYI